MGQVPVYDPLIMKPKCGLDEFIRLFGLLWSIIGLVLATGWIDFKDYSKSIGIVWSIITVSIFIYLFAKNL